MLTLRNSFFDLLDRNFDEAGNQIEQGEPQSKFYSFTPEVESYQKDNNLTLRVAVPGVDPKDVDVSIQGRYISIKAEATARGRQGRGLAPERTQLWSERANLDLAGEC